MKKYLYQSKNEEPALDKQKISNQPIYNKHTNK